MKRKILKLKLLYAKRMHSKSYMKIYNDYLCACGMQISGKIKYIHSSVYIDTAYAKHIHIGDNAVISVNSVILAHDFSVECGMTAIGLGNPEQEKKIISDVSIGNNVFIGAGCIILPGTCIGDNCIIGAGTVCSGVIPAGSVVVGAKHKIIANIEDWIAKKRDLL